MLFFLDRLLIRVWLKVRFNFDLAQFNVSYTLRVLRDHGSTEVNNAARRHNRETIVNFETNSN